LILVLCHLPSLKGRTEQRRIILPVAVLGSRNPSDLTFFEFKALLDTGATSSGIGPSVVKKLDLRSHQKKPLTVATETRIVDYFLFRIGFLPPSSIDNMPIIPYVFTETDGFSWKDQKEFDLILGMDVLSQCDFTLSRAGQWQLVFGQA
jgi:hypothetical protein